MGERIIILGGGVSGLATAYECQKRGHDVTVLERLKCGGQASGAAAGMLAPYSENGEDPDDFFKLCMAGLRLYPDWQQEIKAASQLSFEYTNCGSLYGVYHEADLLALETRQQWQKPFGVEANIIQGEELQRMEPLLAKEIIAALVYPEECHLYTPDYVAALEQACRNIGVTMVEHLEQVNILEWENDITIRTKSGMTFSSDRLVICSGAWSRQLEQTFAMNIPVYPIRGQICAYETAVNKVRHMVFCNQGYLVAKNNGTLICGASEDVAGFDTSVTEKGISRLLSWNHKVFPYVKELKPFHQWAGLRPATQDGFPLIGALERAEHVIFATGHYRNGILLNPITAITVADIIDGIADNATLSSFSPERFS